MGIQLRIRRMNAMNKVLLLVIFATIGFIEHNHAKHYLVETETKVNPEPQQEKDAEAKGSTQTKKRFFTTNNGASFFSRNTTASNSTNSREIKPTDKYPCSRRFYGYWGGAHCYVQHQITDIASWREC